MVRTSSLQPARPRGPDGRFLKKAEPAWLVVREQLLDMADRSGPYPIPDGQRGLAKRLHRSQDTISLAIVGSRRLGIPPCPELIAWMEKAQPKPGPPSRLRPQLLAMADRGDPYPGLRKLAYRFNTNTGNISRMIQSSDRLRRWRRNQKKKRPEGWPRQKRHQVAKAIKEYKDAGGKYTNEGDLAKRLGEKKATVHVALVDSKYAGEFRGWRAAAGTKPGPDSRILPKLLAKADRDEPFRGFRPLAREYKCDAKTIRRLVSQNETLQEWADQKPKGRPTIEDRLLDKARAHEPYTSDGAYAHEFGCRGDSVARVVRRNPELRDWQKKSEAQQRAQQVSDDKEAADSPPADGGRASQPAEAGPQRSTPETDNRLIYQAEAADFYNIPASTLSKHAHKQPGEVGYLWSGTTDGLGEKRPRRFYRKSDLAKLARSRLRRRF
jgi:hypothetical protein